MKKKNKKVTTLDELVGIMLNDFDSNQKYMDKRFDQVDQRFNQVDKNFEQISKNFKEVNKKIDSINLNIVDIVRKEDFDKMESRVVNLEEIVDLQLKKN